MIMAYYLFVLEPGFSIPADSTIEIKFPGAHYGGVLFSNTANDVECIAEKGLSSIKSCLVSGL